MYKNCFVNSDEACSVLFLSVCTVLTEWGRRQGQWSPMRIPLDDQSRAGKICCENTEKYSWITVFFFFSCSSFFWPRHPSVCMGFFQKFSSKFHNRVVVSPLAFTPHHFIVNFFSASTLKNSLKKRNAVLFHLIVLLSGRSGERWDRAVGEPGARGG